MRGFWTGTYRQAPSPATRAKASNLGLFPPVKAPHVKAVDHDKGSGEPEPGDGVLQVIVGQIEPRLSALWPTAWHVTFLRLKEERRHVKRCGRKHRRDHAVQITPEPVIGRGLVVRRE